MACIVLFYVMQCNIMVIRYIMPLLTYIKVLLQYYSVLFQYYPVLQSTTTLLHCITKYSSSTNLYYKKRFQYFFIQLEYYPVLQITSPSTAPATKSDTSASPTTAPATKSDRWSSPSTAPATNKSRSTWAKIAGSSHSDPPTHQNIPLALLHRQFHLSFTTMLYDPFSPPPTQQLTLWIFTIGLLSRSECQRQTVLHILVSIGWHSQPICSHLTHEPIVPHALAFMSCWWKNWNLNDLSGTVLDQNMLCIWCPEELEERSGSQ